ncbi:flagellar protein FlgN [Paenibacillus sp. CAA11]|uniref:flagellar protein FlgN n=1 Tax=Paenibacillus sp. CAA11 TaxID=1532905 RepID=UPI000D34B5FD|nr:flagellar protein FlgN [Paenibacillus sp. CAA11]AWB46238.1 flagellar protein FlgN [Paenibacillus sp. CAA11]
MSFRQIIDSLKQLTELHKELIHLGEEKKQVVIVNDIASLQGILHRETKVLRKIAEADEYRVKASNNFLKEKGIRSALKLNVTELSRLVFDTNEKAELLEQQRELSDVLLALKELNAMNKELTEQSISFIDYSLNLIVSHPDDSLLYQNPAKAKQDVPNRSYFDTKA